MLDVMGPRFRKINGRYATFIKNGRHMLIEVSDITVGGLTVEIKAVNRGRWNRI